MSANLYPKTPTNNPQYSYPSLKANSYGENRPVPVVSVWLNCAREYMYMGGRKQSKGHNEMSERRIDMDLTEYYEVPFYCTA